jgi:HD superfamily phosphodiesterase
MSLKTVKQIQEQIKEECSNLGHIEPWFYPEHLVAVEKHTKSLLKKLPAANKEVALLGVWLHDTQRIRGIKGDHQKIGAAQAAKIMQEHGYPSKTIKAVQGIILTHSCNPLMPTTLEGKILATADALAHYDNNFYLRIATGGQKNLADFKDWAIKKLTRDYTKKIFFPWVKKSIKAKHDTLIKAMTMK